MKRLLFRMIKAGEIAKVARAKYALPSKNDKKEGDSASTH
jgi:hypothetical protein